MFFKKKIAVRQLLDCSLQLNFKGEIKCLRIKKCLNLDYGPQGKKSANGQICNIGVERGWTLLLDSGEWETYYYILSTSFLTGHMGLNS